MTPSNGSARSARKPCVARPVRAGDVVRHTSGPVRARPHRLYHAAMAALLLITAVLVAGGCEDPSLRFNRTGMEAYRQGQYTQARAAFEEAIEQNPDVGVYYFNRGMCEQALGHPTEAIFNYQMATKLDASIVSAYKNAADCHLELGKPEQAREVLEQGTRANPYTAEAFINLSRFHNARGDDFNAKLALAKAVAADPENPVAHRAYAQMLLRLGKRDEAIKHLRKSMELQPIQPEVSSQLSELAPPEDELPPPKPQSE